MTKGKGIFMGVPRRIEETLIPKPTGISDIEKVTNPKEFLVQLKNGETKKLSEKEAIEIATKQLPEPFKCRGMITPSASMLKIQSYLQTMKATNKAIHDRKMSFRGRVDPLTLEEFDEILEQKLQQGYPIERAIMINTKVKTEQQKKLEEKRIKESESQKKEEEMRKFPNVFMRLCKYMSIETYEAELTRSAKTASLEELKEVRDRLLNREKPDLSDAQRTQALTWISTQIEMRQETKPKQQPKKNKKRKRFGLFL